MGPHKNQSNSRSASQAERKKSNDMKIVVVYERRATTSKNCENNAQEMAPTNNRICNCGGGKTKKKLTFLDGVKNDNLS